MEIRAQQIDNVIILYLSGRLDVNAANFIEVVGQCIHSGSTDILCNLEEVEFIDYMGISVVTIAYKETMNNHGRMKFTNVPLQLKKMFAITGLDKVIEIHADQDLALNSFKEDKAIEEIKKMQLRRRFKRLPIDIKIELESTATCLKADILDLSAVGAYIYGARKFKLGDKLVLKLKIPSKDEELELNAKVVWLADKQIQPHLYPGMGVEFYNIESPVQKKLIDFIERNLPLMPSENS